MTAPDDVRARFEAWATDEGYAVERYKDSYQAADTRNAWWGFQAAHADLSGEVRELVEALKDAECELACQPRINSYVIGKVREALAKFTREKP